MANYVSEKERRQKREQAGQIEEENKAKNRKMLTGMYQAAVGGPFDTPIEVLGIPEVTYWGSRIRQYDKLHIIDGMSVIFTHGDFVLPDGRIMYGTQWDAQLNCFVLEHRWQWQRTTNVTWWRRLLGKPANYTYIVGVPLWRYIGHFGANWPPKNETPC